MNMISIYLNYNDISSDAYILWIMCIANVPLDKNNEAFIII